MGNNIRSCVPYIVMHVIAMAAESKFLRNSYAIRIFQEF